MDDMGNNVPYRRTTADRLVLDVGCESRSNIAIEHYCTASIGVAVFNNVENRDSYKPLQVGERSHVPGLIESQLKC